MTQLRFLRLRTLVLLASACLAAFAVVACGDDDDDASGDASTPTATETQPIQEPTAPPDLSAAFRALTYPDELTDGYFIGDPDAPLQLVMFEDFQCPFCLQFTLRSEPELVEKWVAEGKLRIEFRNLPILGEDSAQAAFGAHCAAQQDAFWPYHKELFLAQFDAGQLQDEVLNVGRFAPDELVRHAETAGLDTAAFEACLIDPATYDAVLEQVRGAQETGLRSTPSFLLNGQPLSRYPDGPESWSAFLQDTLEP